MGIVGNVFWRDGEGVKCEGEKTAWHVGRERVGHDGEREGLISRGVAERDVQHRGANMCKSANHMSLSLG